MSKIPVAEAMTATKIRVEALLSRLEARCKAIKDMMAIIKNNGERIGTRSHDCDSELADLNAAIIVQAAAELVMIDAQADAEAATGLYDSAVLVTTAASEAYGICIQGEH